MKIGRFKTSLKFYVHLNTKTQQHKTSFNCQNEYNDTDNTICEALLSNKCIYYFGINHFYDVKNLLFVFSSVFFSKQYNIT